MLIKLIKAICQDVNSIFKSLKFKSFFILNIFLCLFMGVMYLVGYISVNIADIAFNVENPHTTPGTFDVGGIWIGIFFLVCFIAALMYAAYDYLRETWNRIK